MAKLQTILIAGLASSAMGGSAFAQSAQSITSAEVLGNWRLLITPAEREDVSITFESRDGSRQLDFPLSVTAGRNDRLSCLVDDEPAECRIRNGDLIVNLAGGGVRMTFTLNDRTRQGFSGTAGLRVRLLPIGGHIGSVAMTRR